MVFSVALLLTILSNVPFVFLRLAELESGEIDLSLVPGGEAEYVPTKKKYTKKKRRRQS